MNLSKISQPIVVVSHPRSGTHLAIDLLRRQFQSCASWKWPLERNDHLYCNIDELNGNSKILTEAVAKRILKRVPRPIVKTHAWVGFGLGFLPGHHGLHKADWLSYLHSKSSLIYVWREPSSVMCSYYLFCAGAGIIKRNTTISEFIRQRDQYGFSRVEQWNNHVQQWTEHPKVLCINFDDIINQTEIILHRLGNHIGLVPLFKKPLLPRQISSLIASRCVRLFGIRPDSTAIINNVRIKSDDVFDEDDFGYIDSIVGNTLKKLIHSEVK